MQYPHLTEIAANRGKQTKAELVLATDEMHELITREWYINSISVRGRESFDDRLSLTIQNNMTYLDLNYGAIMYSYDFIPIWFNMESGHEYLESTLFPFLADKLSRTGVAKTMKTLMTPFTFTSQLFSGEALPKAIELGDVAADSLGAAAGVLGNTQSLHDIVENVRDAYKKWSLPPDVLTSEMVYFNHIARELGNINKDETKTPEQKSNLSAPIKHELYYVYLTRNYVQGHVLFNKHKYIREINRRIYTTNTILLRNKIIEIMNRVNSTQSLPTEAELTIRLYAYTKLINAEHLPDKNVERIYNEMLRGDWKYTAGKKIIKRKNTKRKNIRHKRN
jgi:hypothetical protein